MDPNVLLQLIRDLADEILEGKGSAAAAEELAVMVTDLDTWVSHGGFLPREWKPRRRQ